MHPTPRPPHALRCVWDCQHNGVGRCGLVVMGASACVCVSGSACRTIFSHLERRPWVIDGESIGRGSTNAGSGWSGGAPLDILCILQAFRVGGKGVTTVLLPAKPGLPAASRAAMRLQGAALTDIVYWVLVAAMEITRLLFDAQIYQLSLK